MSQKAASKHIKCILSSALIFLLFYRLHYSYNSTTIYIHPRAYTITHCPYAYTRYKWFQLPFISVEIKMLKYDLMHICRKVPWIYLSLSGIIWLFEWWNIMSQYEWKNVWRKTWMKDWRTENMVYHTIYFTYILVYVFYIRNNIRLYDIPTYLK